MLERSNKLRAKEIVWFGSTSDTIDKLKQHIEIQERLVMQRGSVFDVNDYKYRQLEEKYLDLVIKHNTLVWQYNSKNWKRDEHHLSEKEYVHVITPRKE